MSYEKPFAPAWENTTVVNNSASATAAVVLPKACEQLVLTNTSLTARTHVVVTNYPTEGSPSTGTEPTTSNGLPILPNSQIRITVGPGPKVIRTIATAADGAIIITPGNGD